MMKPCLPMASPPALAMWSRVGPRLAFAWLLAWAVAWMLAGFFGVPPGSSQLVWVHVGFGGFGFAGHLVLGLGFRLDAAFHQRRPAPLKLQQVAPLPLSITAVLVGGYFHPLAAWPSWVLDVAAWCLLITGLLIGAAAWLQARQGGSQERSLLAGAYDATDRAALLLAPAVVAYALAAGGAAIWLGILHPAVVHLWLAGFVTTAVFAVAHRILPRFSHMKARPRLHLVQALVAIPGPALLAVGLAYAQHPWAVAGGVAEFAAALLYAVLVALAWSTRRGVQPALPLMLAGAVALVGGMVLGLAFLAHASLLSNLAIHAINNLVGFVSLTILGTGSAMLGTGLRPVPGGVHRNVWAMAAGLMFPLVAWEVLAAAGVAGHEVLWVAVATLAAHAVFGLKALRLPPRPRAPAAGTPST